MTFPSVAERLDALQRRAEKEPDAAALELKRRASAAFVRGDISLNLKAAIEFCGPDNASVYDVLEKADQEFLDKCVRTTADAPVSRPKIKRALK